MGGPFVAFAKPAADVTADGPRRPRRVVVHDYCGHPFQVQLSRELARRGHHVLHLFSPTVASPRGALARLDHDPGTFAVEGVALDRPFEKYRFAGRIAQEREYGRRLVRRVLAFGPDVVVSSNTPLLSQADLVRSCRRHGVKLVFWQQDILGVGIKETLSRRLPVAGATIGDGFMALERRLLRQSAAIVAISEDFRPVLLRHRVQPERIEVIENWAPLAELPVGRQDNPWSRAHGLAGRRVVLYSGTLGLKHDPQLLLGLARHLRRRPDVTVVVVSEGLGADWLRARVEAEGLDNLVLLGFQPYADLPDVLATAEVLVAVLERHAGIFSVPSKVLTYFCAGRAVLAAIPPENLAHRLVADNGAGLAVDPGDVHGLTAAADRLLDDDELRAALAAGARVYAEGTFDIDRIGDRFESIIDRVTPPSAGAAGEGARPGVQTVGKGGRV